MLLIVVDFRRLMLTLTDAMSKCDNGSTFLLTPGLQMFIVFVPAYVNRTAAVLLLWLPSCNRLRFAFFGPFFRLTYDLAASNNRQ